MVTSPKIFAYNAERAQSAGNAHMKIAAKAHETLARRLRFIAILKLSAAESVSIYKVISLRMAIFAALLLNHYVAER
jgi:hypothetical protein